MYRKLLVMTAALLVPMGTVVIVGAGSAVAYGPAKAVGSADCQIRSGTGTLSPGLTPLGSRGVVKISFTASLTFPAGPCPNAHVTSPPGVTILGGTLTGTGVFSPPAGGSASSCADFDGPDVLKHLSVSVAWSTSGPAIAKTRIAYKGNAGTVSGSPTDTFTLDTPPALTATKKGSFASPPTLHTVHLITDIPGPLCGTGPYTTFTIVGGAVTV